MPNSAPPAEFQLIAEANRPTAAIVANPISPAQRDAIYRLLPHEAVMNLQLAKRWGVWAVLCTPDWAQTQLHRIPMTRPKGQKLTIGPNP